MITNKRNSRKKLPKEIISKKNMDCMPVCIQSYHSYLDQGKGKWAYKGIIFLSLLCILNARLLEGNTFLSAHVHNGHNQQLKQWAYKIITLLYNHFIVIKIIWFYFQILENFVIFMVGCVGTMDRSFDGSSMGRTKISSRKIKSSRIIATNTIRNSKLEIVKQRLL